MSFAEGRGVVEDEEEAVKLCTQAAEQGLAQAQVYLGDCYGKGEGCLQDDAKAARLFKQAAEQDYLYGQHALGNCYRMGAGVEQDLEMALRLYTQAVEQGLADGQFCVGHGFKLGAGVAQDEEEAVKLYTQAADQGFAAVQWCLGKNYAQGIGGLVKNDEVAARLYRQAAEQNYSGAQFDIGTSYSEGLGVPLDETRAAMLFKQAADQVMVRAQFVLGRYCMQGIAVAHNLAERLSVCLEKGRGMAQSEAEAAASYAAASELGGADALFGYGVATRIAIGVLSAPELFILQLAVSDLALAARLGHAGAVEKLASISSRRELVSACCLGCGATRELRLCSRCRVAAFCDGECTRRMWPTHKPLCKEWREEGSAAQ